MNINLTLTESNPIQSPWEGKSLIMRFRFSYNITFFSSHFVFQDEVYYGDILESSQVVCAAEMSPHNAKFSWTFQVHWTLIGQKRTRVLILGSDWSIDIKCSHTGLWLVNRDQVFSYWALIGQERSCVLILSSDWSGKNMCSNTGLWLNYNAKFSKELFKYSYILFFYLEITFKVIITAWLCWYWGKLSLTQQAALVTVDWQLSYQMYIWVNVWEIV